jgi:hypothetical protein
MIEIEDVIILLLTLFIIILLIPKKNQNSELLKKNENFESLNTDSKWIAEGYKLLPFPNFYQIFGSNDLSRTLEFPGNYNWKLFTNTTLLEKEGLASLISTTNPPFYNFDDTIRLTGFSKPSAVIGLMTPTKISPSGLWLKSFDWYGVSKFGEDKNAKDVIIWANHKNSTDIKLNNQNLIEDAVKLFEFQVPSDASLNGPKKFNIPNYNKNNHPPFTTFYFQILNNWGNGDTVKVGAIVPYFDI